MPSESNKNYKSPPQKKTKKKVQHRNCNEGYICPDDKVCNTRSGRCIRKSSKLLDYHTPNQTVDCLQPVHLCHLPLSKQMLDCMHEQLDVLSVERVKV